MAQVAIAPSILSADFSRLESQIRAVEAGGAELLHLDIMDGHFVPNLTLGPAVVRSIRRVTELTLDAHLMVTDPLAFAGPFRKAGADWITFHLEAVADPRATAAAIRALGARAGMALNPDTPFERAIPSLADLDLLLIMTVHPGFSGQSFRPEVVAKVAAAAAFKAEHGLPFAIEVDGGIGPETAPLVVQAGAEILVAGNAVYGTPDPGAAVRELSRVSAAAIAARPPGAARPGRAAAGASGGTGLRP
jgi:ribulose-phosphate 3-epimerase